MQLPGATKLLSSHPDKKDESSSIFDPFFDFEGISGSMKPTSLARPYASMNAHRERAYGRLRHVIFGQCALRKHPASGTLAQDLEINITPVRDVLSSIVSAKVLRANQESLYRSGQQDSPTCSSFVLRWNVWHCRSQTHWSGCRGVNVLHANVCTPGAKTRSCLQHDATQLR
ncbi:hypothetical protein [Bradyrhizobium sp. CB3481]|uniref:hypothetical protein n=1 Tax=Bradyrhizobium sp. CB3481 TaxID=3039158 RepID=UPI0024B104FB|nr:hypothetical protein [Bradyrhizobium sp. CB3481]WFU14532.1 hypothetical protein QA643_25650 [Bradyrhizobium sp. CB3481]